MDDLQISFQFTDITNDMYLLITKIMKTCLSVKVKRYGIAAMNFNFYLAAIVNSKF